MIVEYLMSAMRLAHYEILEGDEGFYGEIPRFPLSGLPQASSPDL
jgi:hypothetical protein